MDSSQLIEENFREMKSGLMKLYPLNFRRLNVDILGDYFESVVGV